MTLGLNPPAEYPSYWKQTTAITGAVVALGVGGTLAAVMAISASYERHYNSKTCTAFRASAEAQVIREEAGPKTVYKKTPFKRIDGQRCGIY